MADPPKCDECHRPLRRPSPDLLGPKCRRKLHPSSGRLPAISPLSVRPVALVEAQGSLFDLESELLEGSNAHHD